MGFQVSPGVNVSEIDLTTVVPAVSTTDGGLVGVFRWGPLNDITLCGSENDVVRLFGKPDDDTASSFFTAANFLAYGNKLRLVRVADESVALNATADGSGLLIKNDSDYEQNYSGGLGAVGTWAARHAGALGNSLKVSICPSTAAFKQTLAGTASSSGAIITGVGTNFDDVLEIGTIIKDLASGQERKVVAINTAFEIEVDSAFSPSLAGATLQAKWEYADAVGIAPGTSDFAEQRNATNDELHIVVVDKNGDISGTKGAILERHSFLSKASDAKSADGSSTYYVNKINNTSAYIRWMDHPVAGTNWGQAAQDVDFIEIDKPETVDLAGGVDGNTGAGVDAAKILGYDLFANADLVDIALVMLGEASSAVAIHVINNICETRKDCIAFVSPERADVIDNSGNEVEDIIEFRNTLPSSSYAVMDSGWKLQFDKYNDKRRWVPLNGDVAGLCVRTDTIADPWFSPAGFNRGNIKNVLRLAWSPFKAQRDDLYLSGVNPVINEAGQGTVLFGDKTLLAKPSAFDRINVRRLFIVLEKAIARAAKFTLFEFNDVFTRQTFINLVEPFLRDVQGRRGIYDFKVVCDSTNNTGEVIDRNEFVGDIYIKPARSINFIQLNFIAVRTGVEFAEIVGQF